MIRRTSSVPLLYSATSPARWFRTAAMIVGDWGSGVYARHWHASRLVPAAPVPTVIDRNRK